MYTASAMTRSAPSDTPTPIPAFAPVLSPELLVLVELVPGVVPGVTTVVGLPAPVDVGLAKTKDDSTAFGDEQPSIE